MTEVLTYEALKAERDAQQKRADELAVENAAMRGVIDAAIGVANNSSGIAGWHLNGEIADWDEILPELNIETPITSEALAAIQAQGVEKFADFLDSPIDGQHCYQHEGGLARHFASTLREAK